ncbi:GNAT family N-acetyltransferase [Caulobacter segnis]
MAVAPGPTLETERLILRPPADVDLDPWVTLMADAQAARFIGGVQPRALVWRGMASMAGSWALHGFGMFSVIEKASGDWIGRIGPWRPDGWPGDEVGWGLLPSAQGKGYAVEAATATMDWAFDHLGWTDIIHCIDPENVPSQQVAIRLGATNRGPGKLPAPHEASKVELWGQAVDQWRMRNR